MNIEAELRAAVSDADTDSRLLHDIVHGDAAATVDTEGGPVKTVAKAIGDVEASVASAAVVVTEGVAATEAARDASIEARDADTGRRRRRAGLRRRHHAGPALGQAAAGLRPRDRDQRRRRRRAAELRRHPATQRRRAAGARPRLHLTESSSHPPLSDQEKPSMVNQPIFAAAWRQDFATLVAARANEAQDLFTPGAAGTRLHAIVLANDGEVPALVEFGAYAIVGEDVPERLIVDEQAVVISSEDRKWEEAHLKDEIGSTAQGVGKATARRVPNRFRDGKACTLAEDLGDSFAELRPYGSTSERLELAYARGENPAGRYAGEGTEHIPWVVSVRHFSGHNSVWVHFGGGDWPQKGESDRVVCRTYPIRVGGNSGGFSKEIDWLTVSERSNIPLEELVDHEVGSRSGTCRRVGEFDWHMLRKVCHLNSPTDVALTFVDYLDARNSDANRFDQLTPETVKFVEDVEIVAGVPCSLIGNRFDYKCVIDRRRW